MYYQGHLDRMYMYVWSGVHIQTCSLCVCSAESEGLNAKEGRIGSGVVGSGNIIMNCIQLAKHGLL